MPVRKFRNSWWVDFQHGKQRIRKRSPVNSKAGAQVYEATIRNAIAQGRPIDFEEQKKTSSPLFKEFADKWFNTYVLSNNKHSEIRSKKTILTRHLVPYFGNKKIDDISVLQVEEFRSKKLRESLNPKTVNNLLSVFRKCLSTAEEWGMLERVPKVPPCKAAPASFDFLTYVESNQLFKYSTGMWKDMIYTVLKTGMRIGELTGLRWESVDFENRLITIRESVVRDQVVSPKSNKIRHIRMTDNLHAYLWERRQTSGYVFPSEDGTPLKSMRCTRAIRRMAKLAGLRSLGWHTLRHSFASHLAMMGAPIMAIQNQLGHSDIQTTMRYSHLTTSVIASSVHMLDQIDECQPAVNASNCLALPNVQTSNILAEVK